jgi:hypothetical protein
VLASWPGKPVCQQVFDATEPPLSQFTRVAADALAASEQKANIATTKPRRQPIVSIARCLTDY